MNAVEHLPYDDSVEGNCNLHLAFLRLLQSGLQQLQANGCALDFNHLSSKLNYYHSLWCKVGNHIRCH